MKIFPIYFSNNPSDVNKSIIKYFRGNLQTFNKAGLKFDFHVARKEDAEKYKSMKIEDFPTMVSGNQHIVGINKISDHLKEYIVSYNKKQKSRTESDELADYWKSQIGNVKIKDGKVEEEEDDEDVDEVIQKNLQQAVRSRSENMKASPFNSNSRMAESTSNSGRSSTTPSSGSQRSYTNKNPYSSTRETTTRQSRAPIPSRRTVPKKEMTPSETLKNMSGSGKSSLDDQLMAKFFENQEATVI